MTAVEIYGKIMARKALVVPKEKFVVFVVIGHSMMP
jgi:hypothetical protein